MYIGRCEVCGAYHQQLEFSGIHRMGLCSTCLRGAVKYLRDLYEGLEVARDSAEVKRCEFFATRIERVSTDVGGTVAREWIVELLHDDFDQTFMRISDPATRIVHKDFQVCCHDVRLEHEGCTCFGITYCPAHGFKHNFEGEKHP